MLDASSFSSSSSSSRPRLRRGSLAVGAVTVVVALVAVGAFGALLARAQRLPHGVVSVAWDKAACAHCRMHVGEPAFAAQLQLTSGAVHDFDDPGCLFAWLEAHPRDAADGAVHAIYFRHHSEDRWLERSAAGFVHVSPTPMGFGIGVVDATAAGAAPWQWAATRVRDGQRGAP